MANCEQDTLARRSLDEMTILDERSFRHVAIYDDLKQALRRANYSFRVFPKGSAHRADRALLLNLTFWSADSGGDIFPDEQIYADVIAHAAWHCVAARAMPTLPGEKPSVDALFLGEAIASAFDVYLVGRLLGHCPNSEFLQTQVSAMADSADAAGLSEDAFEQLLQDIAADPDRAFVDLRELLFDATCALFACETSESAFAALATFDAHRFAPLLHHYELSNWVLYARAYGADGDVSTRAREADQALRNAPDALAWLVTHWLPGV